MPENNQLPALPPKEPVPDTVAAGLMDALALYADHFRGRRACSFEVAALSTLAACHMGLVTWATDMEHTLGDPPVVTDPSRWPE